MVILGQLFKCMVHKAKTFITVLLVTIFTVDICTDGVSAIVGRPVGVPMNQGQTVLDFSSTFPVKEMLGPALSTRSFFSSFHVMH